MKNISILLFLILISFDIFSQTKEQMVRYDSIRVIANSYFQQNNFDSSILYFNRAFTVLDGKGYQQDKYNAAICYHKTNKTDSTFSLLVKLARKTDFLDYHELNTGAEFENLKTDPRWNELKAILIPESSIQYDSIARILHEIHYADQSFRSRVMSTSSKYGWQSEEMTKFNDTIRYNDSLNLILIKKIIDQHGWLGKSKVGSKANKTFWLVIQHSDISTMKQYFPIMKAAVEKGDASRIHLAYLEDRMLMFEGKKQIYGTQYKVDTQTGEQTLYEVEEPEKLNERRKSIGLWEY